MTYVEKGKRYTRYIAALLVVFVVLPTFAGAFFADSITYEHTTAKSGAPSRYNVQTLELPQAIANPDPGRVARGDGDITIVDESALQPENSPFSGQAEVFKPQSGQISLYQVREGDTLSQVAEMFDVSVNTIRWANDISPKGVITPGMTLAILPVSGVKHVVEDGDTLKSIAKKYEGDVADIRQFNGLSADDVLAVGDEVLIPNGEIEAPKATPQPKASGSTQPTPARPSASPTYAGYYMRPVAGGTRTQGIHGYNGVDIAAAHGTPIMAAASGQVIISRSGGWNGGYGTYVVVKHDNGTQTLYAHNSANAVSMGQWVEQGQVIGYMGSTGRSTGTHVHFEVRGASNPF